MFLQEGSWIVALRAREAPQNVHVRDAYAAGFSASAQRASFLAMSLMSVIAGKMTCVLQLTDTDVARPFKVGANHEKRRLMCERRDVAMAELRAAGGGCELRPRLRTTNKDMLRIALKGHEAVEKANDESEMLLAGLRRNGYLHWVPRKSENRLVRFADVYPALAVKFPERSHRAPESWWASREAYGYDGETRPEIPPYSAVGGHVRSEKRLPR